MITFLLVLNALIFCALAPIVYQILYHFGRATIVAELDGNRYVVKRARLVLEVWVRTTPPGWRRVSDGYELNMFSTAYQKFNDALWSWEQRNPS